MEQTVDFQNDWKLVTLFIGGNDLCQYCNDRVSRFKKSSQEMQADPVGEGHFSEHSLEEKDLHKRSA